MEAGTKRIGKKELADCRKVENMAEKKLVALTFDDGPSVGTTDKVLDVLKENDIVASFFLIGQKITEESAYLVKRAYDMGCTMENHSKTHPGMTGLSDEEILDCLLYTSPSPRD